MSKAVKTAPNGMQTAPFEPADVSAIQAMWNGTASPDQQRRAMLWIIEGACAVHNLSFKPGEDGRRDTDFHEGRRFVGAQIAQLLKTNVTGLVAQLRRKEDV